MKKEFGRAQRRRIRELAGIAYDRELARELSLLEEDFARWRTGKISVHDLDHRIHEYHSGPHRELYVHYSGSRTDLIVAVAIVRGIISESEAGPEAFETLRGPIQAMRSSSRNQGSQDVLFNEVE
jgi:hypothetical protein